MTPVADDTEDEALPPYRRVCPIWGCPTRLQWTLPLCSLHWRMVPFPVQEEVSLAWRTYPRDLVAYLTARAAAINSVQVQLELALPSEDTTD